MRIGHGRDIHRLIEGGKPLILGGVKIPFEKGVEAHSDGDVLMHALSDAFFGALALGDLGLYFNEEDIAYENMDSSLILKKAREEMLKRKYHIENIDIDIILEKPHLREYIMAIKESLANLLHCSKEQISIKAQTNEGLDALGKGKAIECIAVVLLDSNKYLFY